MPVRGSKVGRQTWFYNAVNLLEAAGFVKGAPGVFACPGIHFFSRQDNGGWLVIQVLSKTRLKATFPDGHSDEYPNALALLEAIAPTRAKNAPVYKDSDILGSKSALSLYREQLAPHRKILQSFVDDDGVPTNISDASWFLNRMSEEIGNTEGMVPEWLASVRDLVSQNFKREQPVRQENFRRFED